MSELPEPARSVVLEKTFPYSPEKLWRALTDPQILAQWLLNNDFGPEVGREFQFRNEPQPNWDGVIDCKVLALDRPKYLSYSWKALGLVSVVQFALTPSESGTQLRMEHSGFGVEQKAAYQGATYGWRKFLGNLEQILSEDSQ